MCRVQISPLTSDCCPFSATCYPFSQPLSKTWQKIEAGVPVGWGCSEAAEARQLLPAMGRGGAVPLLLHPRGLRGRGKATRTSAAPSHLAAHPPAEGLRSNARCRVPAWVPEGRRSALRRPGHGCAKVFVRIGADPWEVQSPPGPEPDVLRAAGAGTVSEPGLASCRPKRRAYQVAVHFAAPQGRGTAPASLISSGPKKPREESDGK